MDPLSIEHRCLAYHYTKLGRYSTVHIYMDSRWTRHQLSLDALHTAIAQCTYIWTADGPPSQSSIDDCKTSMLYDYEIGKANVPML